MSVIHICDYGVGNIHNVERAFDHIGAETITCTAADQLSDVLRPYIARAGGHGWNTMRLLEPTKGKVAT